MKHRTNHTWDDIGYPLVTSHANSVDLHCHDFRDDGCGYCLKFTTDHIEIIDELLQELLRLRERQQTKTTTSALDK